MKYFLALLTVLFLRIDTKAQGTYIISGTVKNSKGEKVQSATVFVAGTQNMTMTNAEGEYSFKGIIPGNYLVVVNMLGYNSVKHAITVNERSETLNLILADKEIALQEVVISGKQQSPKDLKRFTRYFLGQVYDPKLCKILNPEIINFAHTDTTLTATTDDFLVIENQLLGYRIKYLLKIFSVGRSDDWHNFDGEYTFEPLEGSPAMQDYWVKNRKATYEGSKMNFLRSLYAVTTRKEGFLLYKVTSDNPLIIERNPKDAQQFVTRTDSGFIKADTKPGVMVVYDKQKAALPDVLSDKPPKKYFALMGMPYRFTLLKFAAKVDSRGSITDRTWDLSFGYWPLFGVAHQLPFEYQPN
ncbi:MAG: carboxypeptidase-like regulatory domain-containing protein [Mucilaginibacter sp.]|nr:carboxypeptidase-like regulatory domain-containing protein [Mucilaginibacter sp.]